MSIIESVRNFIISYSGRAENSPVWVDYLGAEPVEYNIVPTAGTRIIEEYITGSSLREFPFAFQSVESTADNLARLENLGFYEAFAEWLEAQTEAGILPTLDAGKTAIEIEALGWAFLFRQGESNTGIYQITCRLVYKQEA